ncbi:MAG: hypothetical protein HZA51_05675 [Planctomycetes bacterium]|nr:hypothetical protein [Planctomycetota bacterium]
MLGMTIVGTMLSTGCSENNGMNGTKGPSQIRTFGYLGREGSNGAPNGKMRLDRVLINGSNESKPYGRGTKFSTLEYMVLQAFGDPSHTYRILFGPIPGVVGDPAKVEIANGNVSSTASMQVVQIECGWVYLTGTGPQVQTCWVSAGASGSKIVMQITEDEVPRTVHRFFFIEGSSGYVINWHDPSYHKELTAADTNKYVDAYSDGSLSDPILITHGSPADRFLMDILPHRNALEAL